jgi:hypothetical protein
MRNDVSPNIRNASSNFKLNKRALADLRHDSRLSCSRLHTLEITTPQTNQNSRASRQSNGYFRSFEPRVGRTLTSPLKAAFLNHWTSKTLKEVQMMVVLTVIGQFVHNQQFQ